MAEKSNPAVVDTQFVQLIASPGETEDDVVEIGLGGILEFKNGSNMPDFGIEFVQPGPPGTSGPLTGTRTISVQMPDDDQTFTYHIWYMKNGRTAVLREGPFSVRSCSGC